MQSLPPPQQQPAEPATDHWVRVSGLDRDPAIPSWPWWTPLAALALGVVLWTFVTTLIVVGTGSETSHLTPGVSLALDFAFDLSFVAAVICVTVVRGRVKAADFGFRRVAPGLAVGAFVTATIGYYVTTLIYAQLIHLHGKDKLPSELNVSHNTAALIVAAVFVCVVAPISEELIFRGFVFGTLRKIKLPIGGRDAGTWLAAIITGGLFGLIHAGSASPQYLVPLALLGFVLCLLRWRTGSLYPCFALHSFNNALALGINELHWNAAEILGLMLGSAAVIAAITAPFASRPLESCFSHN